MRDKPPKIKEPYEGSFILLAMRVGFPKEFSSFSPYHLTDDNRDLYSEEYRDPMNETAHMKWGLEDKPLTLTEWEPE